VITGPILGNTGGIMPQPGYLQGMRQLASENEIALIFGEVLTFRRKISVPSPR